MRRAWPDTNTCLPPIFLPPPCSNHHAQNFSYSPYGSVIGAGEEITLDYSVTLDTRLMPEEYALAATVFYQDGKTGYAQVAHALALDFVLALALSLCSTPSRAVRTSAQRH